MATNPYATPESDVEHHSGEVLNTSIWNGKGRLSVASFFGQGMLLTIVGYGLMAILVFANSFISGGSSVLESLEAPSVLLMVGFGVIYLVMMWVAICQMIKRFHDRNLSGWWVLSVFIVIGFIILLIPGKTVPNRFGAWRQTLTWEKILAFLYLLFFIGMIALSVMGTFTAMQQYQ